MNTDDVVNGEKQYLVPTYIRPEVVFTHGQGATLYDSEGRGYLDFTSGIAVTALGHSDRDWVEVIRQQAGRLTHVSNLYHTEAHVQLAKRLVENSFADKVFYCNSGSEANEGALKFARKYARTHFSGDYKTAFTKTKIVAFSASFHGRSMGALSATYKAKYREPFGPLVTPVTFAPFNDLGAAEQAIDQNTCAVIVEPVQGEGGVRPAEPAFLAALRALCDEHKALLIFDEVQCGLGRTGMLWAYQRTGVVPDMMTLAKPLAGGLPIGAILVTEAVSQVMKPGDHGSTFAGGPLVCRAAEVVFDRINRPAFLETVRSNGDYLVERLQGLESEKLLEVRGAGLLVGVDFAVPVAPLIVAAREKGLLVINAGENVLRLCPPLIVTRDQIDMAVDILASCMDVIEG